jgi:Domain of unknown function (DUF397)
MSTVDLSRARWRKSSRSNGGINGDCVEIALLDVEWRKSSRSNGGNNGACVEVAFSGSAAAIRDSKNPAGPALVLPVGAFQAVIAAARA